MHEGLCGWNSRWHRTLILASLVLCLAAPIGRAARATQKYGPLELSGNLETQNLIRDPTINGLQFIQNRNTVRIRVDYDWLQNGKLIDRFELPFIERSKLFILYRGVYDGFYDIAPSGNQIGQNRFDDIVGGPIAGNLPGACANGPCPAVAPQTDSTVKLQPLLRGAYSRYTPTIRSGIKFENTLREAYIDAKLAGAPISFRMGRQQVIWGESDQFRLMDIWNPIDVTWHLQQESWDNIRIPLWLGKGLWDIGEITIPGIHSTLSNSFLEVVYNPFDFQPNQKLAFLPRNWSAPYPDPLRAGQVQRVDFGGGNFVYVSPQFNLNGTSYRHGSFERNPQDASEVGVRFHSVTPQGIEFSTDYLYARARAVGAAGPLGVKIGAVPNPKSCKAAGFPCQSFQLENTVVPVQAVPLNAEIVYPYNHIFGLTGNYFEGDYTASVLRLETAYAMGEPFQTVEPSKRAPGSPLGYTKSDVWAGMVGFDRPTWIRLLNPKATWFLTMQLFWNYTVGKVPFLRGTSGANETPYFTPGVGQAGHNSSGFGTWLTGPNAGLVERLQNGTPNGADPSGNAIRRWEHLITFAGTSFYRGGTIVPFAATAWDPVNDNIEFLWNVDYFYTNNFIITLQQKFFATYGSKISSDDPWGAGGLNNRRDETGVKVTYQF